EDTPCSQNGAADPREASPIGIVNVGVCGDSAKQDNTGKNDRQTVANDYPTRAGGISRSRDHWSSSSESSGEDSSTVSSVDSSTSSIWVTTGRVSISID